MAARASALFSLKAQDLRAYVYGTRAVAEPGRDGDEEDEDRGGRGGRGRGDEEGDGRGLGDVEDEEEGGGGRGRGGRGGGGVSEDSDDDFFSVRRPPAETAQANNPEALDGEAAFLRGGGGGGRDGGQGGSRDLQGFEGIMDVPFLNPVLIPEPPP